MVVMLPLPGPEVGMIFGTIRQDGPPAVEVGQLFRGYDQGEPIAEGVAADLQFPPALLEGLGVAGGGSQHLLGSNWIELLCKQRELFTLTLVTIGGDASGTIEVHGLLEKVSLPG